MQSSWGDQSPVIKAGGNVSVTYGLDEERVKAILMEQQEHLFRKMRDTGVAADDRERRLLEQQLQEVSAKLADIERSYNEELARRKAADDVLAQLRGQLPEAQIEQARRSRWPPFSLGRWPRAIWNMPRHCGRIRRRLR